MSHDPFEDRVRDALRQKAAEVRPASGLDAIQRKLADRGQAPARRARAPWLVAAAAVVVAIVGGTLVTRTAEDDRDRTVVAGEGETDGGFASYPLLDAVWPSDDPEVLRGITAAWARDPSPLAAAKLYLQDRLSTTPSDEDLVVDGDTVTLAIETDVVVELARLDDQIWYVRRATSGVLDVGVSFDGRRVTGAVVPGQGGTLELEVDGVGGAGVGQPVRAEETVPVDVGVPESGSVVLRTTLLADVGIVALDERKLLASPDAPAPAPDAPQPPDLGVWPKPADEIAAEDLVDPVDAARLYLMDTAGVDGGVELSELRRGDANSGEVEVSGDLVATIALRQIEGRWHVEAVHTPLVEARGDVPGELWLHANVEGILDVTVLDAWGTVVQSMPGRRMGEGEEVVVVPAEPVHKPFSVRFRFEPIVGNPPGIGDVAVAGTVAQTGSGADPDVHEVPDEAIFAAGGLDPIGTAQGYIEARLGYLPDGMELVRSEPSDDRAQVDWPYGSVFLVQHDGLWYVTESIGASVSFERVALPTVEVFLGEEGVLLVQLLDAEGGVCAEARTDVGGRGPATVTFDDVPCDAESVVATMNEVIAEQAV